MRKCQLATDRGPMPVSLRLPRQDRTGGAAGPVVMHSPSTRYFAVSAHCLPLSHPHSTPLPYPCILTKTMPLEFTK